MFKMKRHPDALARYTMAAAIAIQRPPWENNQVMREELSTVLSNRSAASFEAGDYVGALVDADVVIALKRPWSKGHFRKAKAFLGMGRFEDAKEAVRLGLQFEPENKVCNFSCVNHDQIADVSLLQELNDFLNDIIRASKLAAGSSKEAPAAKSPVMLAD
jgi:tetratricopeptide (TPR) repeat protein